MKSNDKYFFAIFLILAVGLFLIVYFVPLKNTNEEISSIESENNSLRNEISELQVYHDNKAQYESDIDTLKKEVVDIVLKFPSGYKEEDFLLEAIAMEDAADYLNYSSINISDPESISEVSAEDIKKAEIDGMDQKIEYVYQKVDYYNELNYSSLKQAIEEVFSSPYKLNIDSITYVREEGDNTLKGVTTLGFYYVSGNGREYEEPYIEEYRSGTDNIFVGGYGTDLIQKLQSAIEKSLNEAINDATTEDSEETTP